MISLDVDKYPKTHGKRLYHTKTLEVSVCTTKENPVLRSSLVKDMWGEIAGAYTSVSYQKKKTTHDWLVS